MFESNRSVETNDTTTKYKKIRFYVRHDEKEGASYDVQNLFTDKLVLTRNTDYGHTKAKSLILCGPSTNPK